MGIRDRLRRLERLSEGEKVFVAQPDGPAAARFPESALKEVFLTNMRRLRGEHVEAHPLGVAAARSTSPEWSKLLYASS